VLASILLLASDAGTVVQASLLLAVYSAGLALPFLLVGVAFNRTMSASRWLRDRYGALRIASGVILVAIGLLLFFDRFWWLNVGVNRTLQFLGVRD
jgi:cytochrome c-type biogenesis protein